MSSKEYELAVREILKIDPMSPCFTKASEQLERISNEYNLDEDRLYSYFESVRNNEVELHKFISSLLIYNRR
jgi:hypothetical protein